AEPEMMMDEMGAPGALGGGGMAQPRAKKSAPAPRPGGRGMAMSMPAPPPAPRRGGGPRGIPIPAPPPPAYSGHAKNLSALAAIALQAGATRYDLAAPVTIPDKSATMVMLLDRPIPGAAISLFAPDPGVPESASHPFRVARFQNK